jgi:hypothetical protein
MQEKRPHKANLANKTQKKKKKQCIRYQIFWLTYQNNKKKPIRKKNKEPKPRTT